ncbi:MAG: DUF4831 family protein [Bacteroidota bacterium]|nr:DUF4831 family protein [Bacteroidota bacterium]
MKNIGIVLLTILLLSCTVSNDIETYKSNGKQQPEDRSIVYALPQTAITVTLEVTKTTIKKGPYAEYAQKLLAISNVSLWDSQTWAITDAKISARNEADPSQYYTITYKTYPDNLNRLFAVTNSGVILDFANSWAPQAGKLLSEKPASVLFDPCLMEPTVTEKVDTLYKTLVKDTSFTKVPVLKKQIHAKTPEEIAVEAAKELLKTRKRKIKTLRGEYDYHPDGMALKVMVDELNKQEEKYLSLFIGARLTEKLYYTFTFIPQDNATSKELCYFSTENGIQTQNTSGNAVISLQLTKEQEPAKGTSPDKSKNILYIRVPVMVGVSLKQNTTELATSRIPVYQFGSVQVLGLK